MLRGSYTAKIDDRGRLKVPASFRHFLEERYGRKVFVTSTDGKFVRVYPDEVWRDIEEKLANIGSLGRAKQRFLV